MSAPGSTDRPLAVVPAVGDGLEVYAAGEDGHLHLFRIGIQAGGTRAERPIDLGRLPGSELQALRAPGGVVHLLAVDGGGSVHHLHRGGQCPSRLNSWTSLGSLPAAQIGLVADSDGAVSAVAVTPGGRLRAKEWVDGRWTPGRDRWDDLGAISDFLQARLDEEEGSEDSDG